MKNSDIQRISSVKVFFIPSFHFSIIPPCGAYPVESEPKTPDPKPRLLIVEDDEDIRTQMKWALAKDYEVFTAGDRGEALAVLEREGPQAVTLDLGLPPHPADTSEGFAALTELLERDPLLKVIVITGQGEKENALKAVAEGAYDFFLKPIRIEELKVVLQRAFYVSRLERELPGLRQQPGGGALRGDARHQPPDAGGLRRHPQGGHHRRPGADHRAKAAPARSWRPGPSTR